MSEIIHSLSYFSEVAISEMRKYFGTIYDIPEGKLQKSFMTYDTENISV